MKATKLSKSKKINWVYVYSGIFSFMMTVTLWMIFKPEPAETKTVENPPTVQKNDPETVLQDFRLYVFQMASSSKDCAKLSRDHQDYSGLVATRERFPNDNCGDVRAYIGDFGLEKSITVVSPTLEGCRCQVAELKKQSKINAKKSKFSDKDL